MEQDKKIVILNILAQYYVKIINFNIHLIYT